MLKSIKVQHDVYDALDGVRGKNETFGECIDKLIKAYRKLLEIQYSSGPKSNG